MDATRAAIAFFALGANFLGTLVLVLFNPRSRGVRWFVPFEIAIMVWLAGQGWALATGVWAGPDVALAVATHMLPGLFVAFALVDCRGAPARAALVPVVVGALLLPIVFAGYTDPASTWQDWVAVGWQVAGWATGSVLMFRRRTPVTGSGADRVLHRTVLWTLTLGVPGSVILGFLILGVEFFHTVMPLLTVLVQIFLFVGVLRWRYYDIEVRAARSGEIAARTAELERLAVVGELAASFAHEVRNPLTGVRSLAQRLAEEEVDEPRRRRYADVIVREVGRVEKIVADLLGAARRWPAGTVGGPTPLGPLFEDVALLLQVRAGGRRVAIVPDADGLVAGAGREPLAQVLLNLLLNAIDHSPEGGRIELVARPAGDGRIAILVRDQGAGVPPGARERIFQPLYSESGGTGLGLAVVRRIGEEERWGVTVGDAPGGGAEFRVEVPAAGGPA